MTLSRRQLYEAGEPFGDGALRVKPGGHGRICGLGGDSSSDSSSTQTTQFNLSDSRSVKDDHSYNLSNSGNTNSGNVSFSGIGNGTDNNTSVAGSFNTSNITTVTDYGAVAAGKAVGVAAVAGNSRNYDALLGAADKLFEQTTSTTDANVQLASQLNSGATKAAASSAMQNNTVLYVALAAVVIVVGLTVLKR